MKSKTAAPARVSVSEVVWSWIGALLGIMAVAYISYNILDGTGFTIIIGSFGASAVLIYGAIKSPLAQPRNLIGGHILSAIIGVTCYKLFHNHMWFAAPLAVATAIAVMHLTRTLHPPGGATSLIAVIGGKTIHDLGYVYAIVPAGAGAVIMLIVALIVNNIPKNRSYPEYWF
ncbi:HPP family protein [Candidatus Magnetomonas plexicatena]|uniref:HPP family protein n=1 Tax=Candidatus Magnetomonas plexicatena TaxID=2552947 RepID=UPI001100DAAB|nr:HPP family protein [Nitrospirales bacterium LBB_01]